VPQGMTVRVYRLDPETREQRAIRAVKVETSEAMLRPADTGVAYPPCRCPRCIAPETVD
jgi:hypothetical protein